MIPGLIAVALLAIPAPRAQRPPAATPAPPAGSPRVDAADVRASVRAYLGTIDTPIRVEEWRALGPAAVPLLEEAATDLSALPTRRAMALDGLASIGGTRAEALSARLAEDEGAPFVVRQSAMIGVGRLLPQRRAVPLLQKILDRGGDLSLRMAAAQVLTRHGGESGGGEVRKLRQREQGVLGQELERELSGA